MPNHRRFVGVALTLLLTSWPLAGCDADSAALAQEQKPEPEAKAKAEAEAEKPAIADVTLADASEHQLTFEHPVFLCHDNHDKTALYVVEKYGRIKRLPSAFATKKEEVQTYLDLSTKVLTAHNEEGLLALAFHPKYQDNGFLYVYYSAGEKTGTKNRWGQEEYKRRSVVSRFTRSKDSPASADTASEKVLMTIDQPWGNHNGATLLFGKDGFLYISTGDGGAANDPRDVGQNLNSLLGKVLRIDVDTEDKPKAYGIPKDNPFVKTADAKPEVWAWGLRNVWRMSFDRSSGKLFGADVGQGQWEEVNILESGKNYGWRIREGAHPFGESKTSPKDAVLVDPIAEYSHKLGLSITGGYVYRGKKHPELAGVYFYADYVTGRIWGLVEEGNKAKANRVVYEPSKSLRKYNISSFGEDQQGEVYVITYHGDASQILRLSPRKAQAAAEK